MWCWLGRLLVRVVGRLHLRLEHALVDFVMKSEKLSEQNLLVLILDSRVLFIELLLNFVKLSRVDLLDRCVNI